MTEVRAPDGARIHVEDLPGQDPPVVFLHGVLEDGSAWRDVARRVHAAGHRVLLIDDRGHGKSEPWGEHMPWAPEDVARDAEAVLDALAPGGAHLVGASRGATAASWVAVERPDLALSLAVVASPPQASEVFRAHFRRRLASARSPREAACYHYLSTISEDAFPQHALRRYAGRALVVEAGDDALYSPTHTMFWRMFLPYAAFERVEGGHGFFRSPEGAVWMADRLMRHLAPAKPS